MKKCLLILLPFLLIHNGFFAQTVTVSGNVFGLMSEKVLLMKKASKNVSFEGPISGVKITLVGNGPVINAETDVTGSYSLTLKAVGAYKMTIEKTGYSTLSLTVNYVDDGLKTFYPAVSFMLKKDDNTVNALGDLTISNGGKLTIEDSKVASKSTTGVSQSNHILLEKACAINNASSTNILSLKPAYVPKAPTVATPTVEAPVINKNDTVISKENLVSAPVIDILSDTISTAASLKSSIERSKLLLAGLDPKDKNYAILEAQIKNAESRLKQKESLIKLQEHQLQETQKKVMFLALFGVFALLSILLLVLFLFQRKKHVKILDEKNKSITKANSKILSSIRYAATIQSNFFKEKSKLKKLFSKAFIFNQPKDMLSGDFYWFTEKDGYKIVVVADCTGHGVPGGLLTMLGHSLLDDIVTVKGETKPSKILMALAQGVMSAFSREEELEYGMDITVLCAKEGSNEVIYSGITNGLYHCRRDHLTPLSVTPKTIGPDLELADLTDQSILVMKGDCFFMLSDGFPDQFNENKERPEKFNVTRLEEMLKKVAQDENFATTEATLKSQLEGWRGAREQVDDVLIVGVRVD